MRGFHHAALVCPVESSISGPTDLRGKKIGVRAWSQTTGVWVRGILLDEYGVDHRDITWVTAEDAHVAEYVDPPNVVRIAPGQDLKAMLQAGEIDAAIAVAGIDPSSVRPVIANPMAAAAAWFAKTGAYPVNHLLCVKTALVEAAPWLPAELMRLFIAAKAAATEPSAETRFAAIVERRRCLTGWRPTGPVSNDAFATLRNRGWCRGFTTWRKRLPDQLPALPNRRPTCWKRHMVASPSGCPSGCDGILVLGRQGSSGNATSIRSDTGRDGGECVSEVSRTARLDAGGPYR